MLLKAKRYIDATYVLQQGFTSDEVGPGMRNSKRLEQSKGDMIGFSIHLTPFYNTDADPLLKNDPERKAEIEEMIRAHPKFGKDFVEYDGKDEVITMTVRDRENMEKKIRDEMKDKIQDEEIKKLKDELRGARMREGRLKKANEALKDDKVRA